MSAETQVQIRVATGTDVAALARLGAATFIETFGPLYRAEDLASFLDGCRSEAAYARLLSDPRVGVALAFLSDRPEPVGYVVAGPCKLPVDDLPPTAGEVRELYVLAAHQKHKLGTKLLGWALDWLASQRRVPLYIGVYCDNVGAQRLYGRFGFSKVGEYDFPVGRHIDREFILRR
ncbi:MAG: GNAT family N-acetyltransferase [Polyangia bacterium]